MVQNNAHNSESAAKRLKRFQNNGPVETIGTLLNSINNFFNNEIKITPDNFQTTLLFLGIHAIALTIGEVLFNNLNARGRTDHLKNYKDFLEKFVDGQTPDVKFSTVVDRMHKWRNVVAHQWISISGHGIAYDYDQNFGWLDVSGILVINPKIYCDTYLAAFKSGGRIWDYNTLFTEQQLNDIHNRILTKYQAQ